MYEGELPIKPGTATSPTRDICTSRLTTNPAHLRLINSYSMHDLSTDFVFFSTAFWHFGAGLNIDPVQDWYDKHPRHVPLATRDLPWKYHLHFDAAAIGRSATADHQQLRRTIWMCPKEEWPSLQFFLGNVTLIDSKVGFAAQGHRYCLDVPDLFKIACGETGKSVLQVIPMHVFTLHAARWMVVPKLFTFEGLAWLNFNLEYTNEASDRST